MNPGTGWREPGSAGGCCVVTRALCPCSHWGLGRGGEGGAFRETEALPAGADLAQRKVQPSLPSRARRVGMWSAARSGSGPRPRPAPPFTGTRPRTDDASSPAAGFSYLNAWWGGGSMPTLLTHCSVMGHGSVKAEGQADLGQLPLTSPGPQACSFRGHVATETQ